MDDVAFKHQRPTDHSLYEILNHHFTNQISVVKPNSMEHSSHKGTDPPVKPSSWNYSTGSGTYSLPPQISFSNPNGETQFDTKKPKEEAPVLISPTSNISTLPSGVLDLHESIGNQIYEFKACQGSKKNSTKGERFSCSQVHIIAERKRREKLNQRLIALAAMVPGLKKMDKVSILEDAIKYVKQLQEQVKALEEQATETKSKETLVYVIRKCVLNFDRFDNLSLENNLSGGSGGGNQYDVPLPEIEARFCDESVLIRIHCEKRKGVVEKTVAEIEKLHLSVVNSSVMTFGSSFLDITIIALMEEDFSMAMIELVKNLRATLKLFL